MNSAPIDIVIPWVDSNDLAWRKEKNEYAKREGHPETIDESEIRYRDWDTIRYLFRSIDLYMPWVNKVFFITWGHLPEWMNPNAKKLRIVKHSDYMPSRYLPTFSSHAIELNIHRIEELSEQFVYFNDDLIVLRPTKDTDFFNNGLPRDYALMTPLISTHRLSVQDTALTDIEIINDHFNKNKVIKENLGKWINPCYGKQVFKTFCLMPWPRFSALLSLHQCNPYLKTTFKTVWKVENELLESTSMHKFRTRRDLNQWIMRYWQLASGTFEPIKPYGRLYGLSNDNTSLFNALSESKHRTICINDNGVEEVVDYEKTKFELITHLEQRFPEKSSFEI